MDDMTRRGFIAAGAVVAAPYILRSQDKAGTKNPIIGEGEYKCECIHDLGNLPSNIKYGNTQRRRGTHQIHTYSPSSDGVVVFDERASSSGPYVPRRRVACS
jgi:hypothetical protein